MQLAIKATGEGAKAISFLLAKNPQNLYDRAEKGYRVRLTYTVFTETEVEVILFVTPDPVELVKNSPDAFKITQYINDREFVVSSLFCSYIRSALGTALNGRTIEEYLPWVNHAFELNVGFGPVASSPTTEPSPLEDYLEHPHQAFEYYRQQGVTTMVVEKKHMGSRAILLLFKDAEVAVDYVGSPTLGTIYTRTGRAFFDQGMTQTILEQLNAHLTKAKYFAKHKTDFVLLDAEILPWNLKAKELISAQYAHVSEVALMDRQKILEKLQLAQGNGWEVNSWLEEYQSKLNSAEVFRDVFQKYCWDTNGLEGIKIAPFHVLAHSDRAYFDQSHCWHMEQNREFSKLSSLFIETEYKVVRDDISEEEATRWWQEMTENGHEGFVVKPETFIAHNAKGRLIQPAIKVRGRKYLHIIYGIDYLQPENLTRLKQRKVGRKQRHALMEFALGIEGVRRFVNREPIAQVHECVLATLALEAEPVDLRL